MSRRLLTVMWAAAAAVVSVAGCSHAGGAVTWPGHLDSPDRVVEFFGQPVEAADVKVLCSGTEGGGVALLISGPGGLSASASQKADGSQVSDVTVKGSGEPKVLAGSAHWVSANGETGFQLDQSGDFDDVFYLHDGAALCAARPAS